ncbi:MAG: hypothetical protein EPO21_10085 [Chloroflexota bacterium]|nr:MAG: hypothetical protein EPO21_10085 [Chloroflexota bacterium]
MGVWAIAGAAAVAVLVNLPMGYWRRQVKKFSWQWFLAIHLPIPAIFAMRQGMELSFAYIPLFFASSVVGQLAGSYLCGYWPRVRRTDAAAKRRRAQ